MSLNKAATPPLDDSTVKTKEAYETLLESKSSHNNSRNSETSSNNETSSSYKSTDTPSPCTNSEKFEIDYKLKSWRSKHSKSLEFCSLSLLHRSNTVLKSHSEPTSPSRGPHVRLFSSCHSADEASIAHASKSFVAPFFYIGLM